ncbi:hypothetical protein B1B04_13835 [Lysinibacillus sp. KCTC 33748]|uniref:hypothetical protein n=1 Tax=unclassified Lysinibacillus TaxID=2636778 RepID=UPI0009A7C84B|nr:MULTISPECIES: hypothetical protein [unclassified Lysinibacillus]OXS73039.1 hypothetical protein B1B04_13835 [Lysinibacillus sp. KCTC 33748]SKB86441.1 hypothetical protein SAMN06295926_11086 [Lysinibacillus sp. AC-3]
MDIYNKLIRIRVANTSTTKQKVISIVNAIIIGIILGLAAKLADSPNINPFFDNLGGRLGIWVFVATLLSVFSNSPKLAALKIFAFFGSMLTVYYVYTILVLHFFPEREIIFWGICGAVSPPCAYIMWYARGSGLFSNIISALPITVLLSEAFELRNAYLPVHTHYYLIPWLVGVYLIMIVVLFLIIPKNKIQILIILPISIILSLIVINLNILGLIFG